MNICSLYYRQLIEHMFIKGNYMRGAYRKRRISQPPNVLSFKPSGIPRRMLKSLVINIDEYEAIRLADYEGMEHEQAAERMAISRPTFTRLIEKARNKIAQAMIEGMELIVSGGNIEFVNILRRCQDCGDEFIGPSARKDIDCPECGSENISDLSQQFFKHENKEKKQ
jgi:predicted DNA-binding protein (UPF0251 family)